MRFNRQSVAKSATSVISVIGLGYVVGMGIYRRNTPSNTTPISTTLITILYGIFASVILCMLRWGMSYYLFKPIGEVILQRPLTAEKQDKFSSCAFKTVFFVFITMYEFSLLKRKDYWPPPLMGSGNIDNLWLLPIDAADRDILTVYVLALGYHMHSTVFHILVVKRRKDFYEMVLHHVLTLWLITLSLVEGHLRIGTLMMFTNDLPDIFVYLAKTLGITVFVALSETAYVGMLVSYMYFRVVFFQVFLFPSALSQAKYRSIPEIVVYSVLLLGLHALQLYWLKFIINVGLNVFKSGNRKDISQ